MPWIEGLDVGGAACATAETHPECPGTAPSVAFLVAGSARQFVRPEVFSSYAVHMLASFRASNSSQLFLYFSAADEEVREVDIQRVTLRLRPAAVRVVRAQPCAKAAKHEHGDSCVPHLPSGACLPNWSWWQSAAYVLRAFQWWSSMNASWGMALEWEATSGSRFDRIVFSRPDLQFHSGFGPWCAYDSHTLYVGGLGSPDFLFIMPRSMSGILTTLDMFLDCAGQNQSQPCCRVQSANPKRSEAVDDWCFSYWPLKHMRAMHHTQVRA